MNCRMSPTIAPRRHEAPAGEHRFSHDGDKYVVRVCRGIGTVWSADGRRPGAAFQVLPFRLLRGSPRLVARAWRAKHRERRYAGGA